MQKRLKSSTEALGVYGKMQPKKQDSSNDSFVCPVRYLNRLGLKIAFTDFIDTFFTAFCQAFWLGYIGIQQGFK